jgi:hypothetical protein
MTACGTGKADAGAVLLDAPSSGSPASTRSADELHRGSTRHARSTVRRPWTGMHAELRAAILARAVAAGAAAGRTI